MNSPEAWTEHIDVIVPGVLYLMKLLGWIIGAGFAALCGTVAYIGRVWAGKIEDQAKAITSQGKVIKKIDERLDHMHGAMMLCESCASAMERYGRRHTDFHADDILD